MLKSLEVSSKRRTDHDIAIFCAWYSVWTVFGFILSFRPSFHRLVEFVIDALPSQRA